jgi:hypothetical protein
LLYRAALLIVAAAEGANLRAEGWRSEQQDWLSAYNEAKREQPAPELAAAMRETRTYRDALEQVQRLLGDSGIAHSGRVRSARSAATAALTGKPLRSATGYGPTADAIRAEVDADDAKDALIKSLRDGITQLATDVQASADATRPSKKSGIEDELAIALRKLLETP